MACACACHRGGAARARRLQQGQRQRSRPQGPDPRSQKIAGDKTIAAGLAADGKFMASAKAAGLDQTLAGPGPYTVFVPDDAAFNGGAARRSTPPNRGS